MAVEVSIEIPKGGRCTAFALIDLGAEANFISQMWVKENNLPDTSDLPCEVKALDGHYIKSYRHHTLSVQITDLHSET